MYAVQRWPAVTYDGTNSSDVMRILGDYQIVSEADGVLTLSVIGGGDWRKVVHIGDIACMGAPWTPAEFGQMFHVLPEPEPTP